MQQIDDSRIERIANEPWYVSSRASQIDRFARCLKLIESEGWSPRRVYDVGCANGQFSLLLTNLKAHVTGIDINCERVRDNQLKYSSVQGLDFQCEDFLTAGHMENEADLVTALEVIYYFSAEQQQLFFQKTYEVLKPGGRILLSANIFFTSHLSEESLLNLISSRFHVIKTDKIYRKLYYCFELPLIKLLDQIKYLENLRIFSPNILRLNRRFFPGLWNYLLLRPSDFMDRFLLPGVRVILIKLLESMSIYKLITEITRVLCPRKGQSQLIIIAEKSL
jgi:2-polyprenyl-3-methyl-5-hydroxy-6-metoxy-1,4-benzoquinol methylase